MTTPLDADEFRGFEIGDVAYAPGLGVCLIVAVARDGTFAHVLYRHDLLGDPRVETRSTLKLEPALTPGWIRKIKKDNK